MAENPSKVPKCAKSSICWFCTHILIVKQGMSTSGWTWAYLREISNFPEISPIFGIQGYCTVLGNLRDFLKSLKFPNKWRTASTIGHISIGISFQCHMPATTRRSVFRPIQAHTRTATQYQLFELVNWAGLLAAKALSSVAAAACPFPANLVLSAQIGPRLYI